jgi:hypothetical protein
MLRLCMVLVIPQLEGGAEGRPARRLANQSL